MERGFFTLLPFYLFTFKKPFLPLKVLPLKSHGANTGAMIMLLMFAPWLYVFKVSHGYVMLTVYKFLL